MAAMPQITEYETDKVEKKNKPAEPTPPTKSQFVLDRERDVADQTLLKDVPCWACGHKGGARIVDTRQKDGVTTRQMVCRASRCGFVSRVVQKGTKPPELAPDSEQNADALPVGTSRYVNMEKAMVARETAKQAVEALTGEDGELLQKIGRMIDEKNRKLVEEFKAALAANGNGGKAK